MSELAPEPTPGDKQAKRAGLQWLGAAAGYAVLTVALILTVLVIGSQTRVIAALSSGLTQQRDQFTECKNKPATAAAGCSTPVAAEPSVITKQGNRGLPGLPGSAGQPGLQGSQGPIGPQGPQGIPGPIGKTGPPPGCALLSSACVGVPGATGPAGKAGADGKDGANGLDGKDGAPGKDGVDGKNGTDGTPGATGPQGISIADADCIGDDTQSFWRLTLSDGTLVDGKGPCRIGPELP